MKNVAPDPLSHNNFHLFHSFSSGPAAHTIPHNLTQLFLSLIMDWNSGTRMMCSSEAPCCWTFLFSYHWLVPFCTHFAFSPFPLTKSTLCQFMAFLVSQNLSLRSICLYMSVLCFQQIANSGSDPALSDTAQLHDVLRGISRLAHGSAHLHRLTITIDILVRFFHVWKTASDQYEANLLWAAATLDFFSGLSGPGNLCWYPRNEQVYLALADIHHSHNNPASLAVTP